MIELIPTAVGSVIGLRICGKIKASDFEEVVGLLDERFERHEKMRIYADLSKRRRRRRRGSGAKRPRAVIEPQRRTQKQKETPLRRGFKASGTMVEG